MHRSRFGEAQIIGILKQPQAGRERRRFALRRCGARVLFFFTSSTSSAHYWRRSL